MAIEMDFKGINFTYRKIKEHMSLLKIKYLQPTFDYSANFIPKMTSTIKKPFFVLLHPSTPLWRIGNTCPHKNLCTNVHSNAVYKSQRMGKTQTSIN